MSSTSTEAPQILPRAAGATIARSRRRAALLFIAPAAILLIAIFVYPFAYALRISFTEWTLGQQLTPVWTGLANYVGLLEDDRFLNAIFRTTIFVGCAVSIEMALGFLLALLFNKHLPAFGIFRTLAVLPVMVMPVATGLVWFYVLNFRYGPLNVILRWLHLPTQNWLPHPTGAIGALILADVWQWTPFVMIVLVAGLRSLPEYVYEAAALDGLGPVETFFKITLPLLRPVIFIVLLLRFMDACKLMDLVFMLTKGGPAGRTETLSYYIYVMGLQLFHVGLAAAVSIVFLIFINVVAQIFVRFMYREQVA
ncbi:MAG: sugar ABC transporter permease [Alphaproteobacteria bacterium]|nr:sugar ABC transporter permease [Alphaproteobacteria bacterium]